jgi:hypothetical protein
MRWHVELNEAGKTLYVEHLEDPKDVLRRARELAAEAVGGHQRASPEEVERAVGRMADEGLDDVMPGVDRAYPINDQVTVVIGGLDENDSDEDCWVCGRAA